MSCVALRNTSRMNVHDSIHTLSSSTFVAARNPFIHPPIHTMNSPMSTCMGTIQDLRRPSRPEKNESTTGDQNSYAISVRKQCK